MKITSTDDHEWHVALNQYNSPKMGKDFQHWMYNAKNAAKEVCRIARVFAAEREGRLTKVHKQCSMSEPVELKENFTTCVLGQKCRECPHLIAISAANMPIEQVDQAQAWTCVGHILQELGKQPHIDISEGFVLTEDDRMFWENVYDSMRVGDSPNRQEEVT